MVWKIFPKTFCLENKLLLISINFTPKTSHSCLFKNGTLSFPGGSKMSRDGKKLWTPSNRWPPRAALRLHSRTLQHNGASRTGRTIFSKVQKGRKSGIFHQGWGEMRDAENLAFLGRGSLNLTRTTIRIYVNRL